MASQTTHLFSSLNRDRVPFSIVHQITTAIAEGRLLPGSKLPPEAELTIQFGVGRNALREAIKVLEAYGFVVIRRGEGTYIQDSCTFELLAPLFMHLYRLQADVMHTAEYFLALRHAQMVFNTSKVDPDAVLEFSRDLRAISRKLETPETSDPDEIYKKMDRLDRQRDFLSGQLPLARIISFSQLMFSQFFLCIELKDYSPQLLQKVTDVLLMEAIAVSSGAKARFGDYLYHRMELSKEEIEIYGRMITTPQRNDSFWETIGSTSSKRIMWELLLAIFNGEYEPGSRFPTEPEMIERYHVSRNVIREATKCLEALGLLEIRRPEGTFLCSEPSIPAPFINMRAYGRILSSQDASSFLNFKIQIRDAVLYMANCNASREERAHYCEVCQHFADVLSSPDVEPRLCYHALDNVNAQLSRMCRNPILQSVNEAVAGIATESRYLFIDRAIEYGRQKEVIRSYLEEADLLKEYRADDIPEVMLRKVELWKSLEITKAQVDCDLEKRLKQKQNGRVTK